jgi:predicted dehydrogenase
MKLSWGILATGGAARAFAKALKTSRRGRGYAVASRDAERAARFAAEFAVQKSFGSYEQMLDDPQVDAVYIATPHPQHTEDAVAAASKKKHLLVEKPLAMSHAEALQIAEAAEQHHVLLMENFAYRCHPATAKLIEMIKSCAIGQVRMICATFSFHAGFDPANRLFSKALGGGAILDVGCYATSIARHVAGAATASHFADPIEVNGVAHIGETGVDEWAAATLKFDGGVLAQLSAGIRLKQDNIIRVYGSAGSIMRGCTIPDPAGGGDSCTITLQNDANGQMQELMISSDQRPLLLAVDSFALALAQGRREAMPPAPTVEDSLGNMRTLDLWRSAAGVSYDVDSIG